MPERNTPEYYAMGLLNQILVQGDNALLQKKLVDELGYTSDVSGGINYLGNMFNYNGPMQFMFNFTYDNETSKEQVISAVDKVMHNLKITPEMLDNAMVKMRSQLYDELGGTFGLGRADLLATFALFDDNPSRINELEEEFRKVTPEVMNRTVSEYLRDTNRTILTVNPLLATNEKSK
jgi:predicted Zn-dependent peptidase